MRCFLVVILVVLTVKVVSSCENICTFLYNNPDWKNHTSIEDTAFRVSVTAGSVTGIITASFETFYPNYGKNFDFLRFEKGTSGDNQPIYMEISYNLDGEIYGKQGGTRYGIELDYKISNDIQISNSNSNFYKIYIGDPGGAQELEYNHGSDSIWKTFKDNEVLLVNVDNIKSDGRCTVYKFISACTDPTPRLCDDEQQVSVNVTLGSSFTLSCSGSGAPFLNVTWTKDGYPTDIEPTTVSTATEADHKIQSTITIERITPAHLGTWNCTILNKNFHLSVTKTYEFTYTYPAKVVISPDFDYYRGTKTNDTTLTWVVQGLPLEQVTLDCGGISVSREENITCVPPQLTLTLVLRMQDVVNCVLKDVRENVMETRNITRVGYNCEAGEGGVGKDCVVCKTGQTSEAGIGDCFIANSSCADGFWGVGENCTSCPENQTSFNGTVKIQECFPDVSYCEEGEYGYGANCSSCPDRKTSYPKTKKITECFPDVSYCKEGQYGYDTNCSSCPDGKTSYPKTKKITECFPDVSYCKEGKYGYGTNCSLCPIGTTSRQNAKELAECYFIFFVNNQSSLVASWTLAGLFFVTTLILSGVVFQKLLRGKCPSTDEGSIHEYVENTIIQPPAKSSAVADTTYDNHELYKL